MKKVFAILCVLFAALAVRGQGKVNTRKYILNDFNDKVTQVVLSGNDVMDSGIRQEVVNVWTSSPFEFCTMDRFETIKTSDQYYFLIPAESRFKEEENPGMFASHGLGVYCPNAKDLDGVVRGLVADGAKGRNEIRQAQLKYRNLDNAKNNVEMIMKLYKQYMAGQR